MFIILKNRPDRMGANLTWYIMQIIYAHYHKYFIHHHGLHFSDSIFIKTIIKFVDEYNFELGESLGNHDHGPTLDWVEHSEQDWPGNNMIVCKKIKCDLVSYFKKHLFAKMRTILNTFIPYSIPTKKTIGVHLRLDDVETRFDYEGIFSSNYYRDKINNGNINIDLDEEHRYCYERGIFVNGWGRNYNSYDCQAPIAEDRIQRIIDQAKTKYPDHEIVIVASPLGKIELPYPTVRSENMDDDLIYLCNCDVIICSRSLYCFSSVYLGNAQEIFIPMWGHIAGTGLTSKYDNANLTYFY